MKPELTPKAQRDMERVWALKREVLEILGQVVAEWKSDPMSVQCFDLRIVNRAITVLDEIKLRDPFSNL